jgi:hypothetical protein
MRPIKAALTFALVLGASSLFASGPVGLYGIIDKVVFEPNEAAPERLQVWGVFAYADIQESGDGLGISPAKRGYLYFKIRSATPGFTTDKQVERIKNEWLDLKSVAGTGQAVGFGKWGYIARFDLLQPDATPRLPAVILENTPGGGTTTDLRVRPATQPPASPAMYETNAGVIKLDATGRHAAIVKALKAVK